MKSFLEHVAEDIIARHGTDLSRTAVVFPNKRASLFLNEHLARLAGKPIWSPAYITISELFRRHSSRQVADPIKLVCELHKSFTAQTGIDETLDHFYGWGQLLLADFDDLDKQMADADRVLANLTDLHEMDDDTFLTEQQRQVLRRFFSNFSADRHSELRQRFLRLWSRMADIYHDFNRRLEEQQLAYEGALYREVATGEVANFHYDTYIFVGFNVLLRVEQQLFSTLHRQGRARFYWDFDRHYMGDNSAGQYIAQHLANFPNELDTSRDDIYNCFAQKKEISIVSASTENIQARYATSWLRQKNRVGDGRKTAIVLCNEALLSTLIHCLPEEVPSVNITTGYPLAQSPAAALVNLLVALHRDGYDHQRQRFRPRQVRALMRHPYLRGLSPSIDELLLRPFSAQYSNEEMLLWLCEVVEQVAHSQESAQDSSDDVLRQESIFKTYTLLNRLLGLARGGDLTTDIVTLGRLLAQLMQATAIPFHGEPAEGLQVMGVLETRNLDFSHLLILSASEGNLPRGASDTSFIPYSLRRAYGLTTPDHKVDIYSYYFYRLLQRATDITIVYNNATTDGQKGEMSRFLLQLMVESPHPISFATLQGGQTIAPRRPQAVENRATLPQLLTPTAINRYLRCPLQFHYHYVCQLREPDQPDDDETIDNRIFGNIFHEASHIIYTRLMEAKGGPSRRPTIAGTDIDHLLKTDAEIHRAVDEAFRKELFNMQQGRRMPNLSGLQLISREVIIHYLRQLLALDRKLTPFTILDLECDVSMPLQLPDGRTVNIGGRIDRLDCIADADGHQRIRVIDYKTGAHRLKPLPDVDAVFNPDNLKEHSDYFLQAMLYSLVVAREHSHTPVSPALLFIQHTAAEGYDPTLQIGNEPVTDMAQHATAFTDLLCHTVARMYDNAVPLAPTTDQQRCNSCPYRQLCWRL